MVKHRYSRDDDMSYGDGMWDNTENIAQGNRTAVDAKTRYLNGGQESYRNRRRQTEIGRY